MHRLLEGGPAVEGGDFDGMKVVQSMVVARPCENEVSCYPHCAHFRDDSDERFSEHSESGERFVPFDLQLGC